MMSATDSREGGEAYVSGVGQELRAGREAAGLSIDDVASQLKLAPRQVKALEDEDFALLPGRTFTRGFLRNYARLLGIDADALVAQLPDASQSRALESPALHPTSTIMGELPSAAMVKPGFGRWLIPLALVACIVAAAAYEWYRNGLSSPERNRNASPTLLDAPFPPSAPVRTPSEHTEAPTGEAPPLPAQQSATVVAPAAPPASSATALPNPLSSPVAPPLSNPNPTPAFAASGADVPLVLSYKAAAWTEVRDSTGKVLLSRTVSAGMVERLAGAPPFELNLGNASAVSVTLRGMAVDFTPHLRQNMAHFTVR